MVTYSRVHNKLNGTFINFQTFMYLIISCKKLDFLAVYVVNKQFSRHPDRCLNCFHNLVLLTQIYHTKELSNEVLYNPVSQGALQI